MSLTKENRCSRKEATNFIPPQNNKDTIYKIEHWVSPGSFYDVWTRTKCKLYENLRKANVGFNNTSWQSEDVRIMFELQNGKWIEIKRELDVYL